MTEVQETELEAFKAKVYAVAQKAKADYGWCGEIDTILRELGVEIPQDKAGEGPAEDGLYRVGGTTYFVIRYTEGGYVNWLHTALHEPKNYCSTNAGTWADIVSWVTGDIRCARRPEDVAGVLVKI